ETAMIPVVVISAKSLTPADRHILDEYSDSVWLKGGFETRQLVDHVVSTLGHMPVDVIQQDYSASRQKLPTNTEPKPDMGQVIVMIDDNPQDVRLAKRMLSESNFHVIEAANGRDGFKAIYNYHPDLILLDLILPDMDGFSIIETLQKDEKLRDIPVIVL